MTTTEHTQMIDNGPLARGEIRTFGDKGLTVKLYAIMGGGMTRVEVRAADGHVIPERCQNFMHEIEAIRAYVATCRWLTSSGW